MPQPEWWISGSEYRFIGKKKLGVQIKIVEGLIGVRVNGSEKKRR